MKDGGERECNAVETVECNSSPEESPDHRLWKDPEKEEKKRELQKRNLDEVQDFQGVKIPDEVGNLFEADCPNVSSKTVWNDGSIDDNDRWYTGYQCG